MTHEELVAKRERYRETPFDSRANAQKIRETGTDLWGHAVLMTEQQRELFEKESAAKRER